MPELPDLEVFRENIFARLTDKNLKGLRVFNPKKAPPERALVDGLVGRMLMGIGRAGKELAFDFGDKKVLTAHLMLSGTVSIVDLQAVGAIPCKMISLDFARESLVLSDMGGLCTVKYMPPKSRVPDALGDDFTPEYLIKAAQQNRFMNVKAFLICQKIIRGIGNAYADEILWAARISPKSFVGKIPDAKLNELHGVIIAVLRGAIESIRRISPDIITGEERSFLKVHNKALQETETGYPIIVEKVATKTTYYTKEQALYW